MKMASLGRHANRWRGRACLSALATAMVIGVIGATPAIAADGYDSENVDVLEAVDQAPSRHRAITFVSTRFAKGTINQVNSDGSGLRRISPEYVVEAWLPSVSEDGSKIAFIGHRGDGAPPRIWVSDGDGANARELSLPDLPRVTDPDVEASGPSVDFPSISPRGDVVLFTAGFTFRNKSTGYPVGGSRGIYRAPFGGGTPEALCGTEAEPPIGGKPCANARWPSYSPDGTKIVYQTPQSKAHIVTADGSDDAAINDDYDLQGPYSWSAKDPNWIAGNWRSTCCTPSQFVIQLAEFYLPDPSEPGLFPGLTGELDNFNPKYTPDGAFIVFQKQTSSSPLRAQIYSITLDGKRRQILSDIGGENYDPWPCCGESFTIPDKSDSQLGSGENAATVADPVNLFNGNASFSESDLSVATAGPQLSFARTYNNADSAIASLGRGWRSNFDQRVDVAEDGSGDAIWTRADGRRDRFVNQGGSYSPIDGRHDAIVAVADHFEIVDTANIKHVFGDDGRLFSVADRYGVGYSIAYDGALPVSATHTKGPSLTLEYDGGRLASVTSSEGPVVTYGYNGASLVTVTKPGGVVTTYGYDGSGLLSSVTDPAGKTIFAQEYAGGAVSTQSDGLGNKTRLSYVSSTTPGNGAGSARTPDGYAKAAAFDERGFITASRDEAGAMTKFAYNEAGDRTQTVDQGGHVWTTQFNVGGDPEEVTDPNGAVSTSRWRDDHQPDSTTDPTGRTTTYAYDSETGALNSIDGPGASGTTVLVRDPDDGSVASTISPDGLITRTDYDEQGRVHKSYDPGGRPTRTDYFPDGSVKAVTSPGGETTTYFYDEARRVDHVNDALGRTVQFGYDASGNQRLVRDPRGYETSSDYDDAYNLTRSWATVNGETVEAKFTYDDQNRLESVTPPGATYAETDYRYDVTGRVQRISEAGMGSWRYAYTPRGEVALVTAPDGAESTFAYDPAGRLVEVNNSKAGTTTMAYDDAGRVTTQVDESGREIYTSYDDAGRPDRVIDTTVSNEDGTPRLYGVEQVMSPGGRRNSLSIGHYKIENGLVVGDNLASATMTYRSDGLVDTVTSPELLGDGAQIAYDYDPTTGRVRTQYVPGSVASLDYDELGRVKDLSTIAGAGGPIPTSFSFPTTYDEAGNVKQMGSSSYAYDELGRLKDATDELGNKYVYEYDIASNRKSVTKNGSEVQALTYADGNRITSPGFTYDNAGRLVADTDDLGRARQYQWDGKGRLITISVRDPGHGHHLNALMTYDAAGRLAERTIYRDFAYQAEHLYYHYDGDRLVGEEDMTGTVREYLYAGGEAPTAMRSRNSDGSYSNFFFVTNTHGDVVALTDKDGNIVNRYAYGPWGEATRVSEQVHQPFRYAGYRYEDGFDLYYLRARWYDAGTGRFLSRDPVRGSAARILSLNRYTYAFGSPVTYTDDCGRSPSRPRRLPAAMWPHLCHLGHRLSEASDLEWSIAVASIKVLVQDWYENVDLAAIPVYRVAYNDEFLPPQAVGEMFGVPVWKHPKGVYIPYQRAIFMSEQVDICDVADSEYGLENLLHEFWHAEQHAVDGARFVRAFPGGSETGPEAVAYEDDAYRNASRILGAFVATYRPL